MCGSVCLGPVPGSSRKFSDHVKAAEKRLIGEEVEPGGRPKAPGRLELLQRFVNTYNHDFPEDWDRLGNGRKATAWLREKRLMPARAAVSDADAARLRVFREALRAVVLANHGGDPPAAAVRSLARMGEDAHLRVQVDRGGETSLARSARGVDGAIAELLAILHEAQISGNWRRLKGCRTCGYAFYDRSKNRSAAWCDMSICGNRSKNRTYYRRRTTAQPDR